MAARPPGFGELTNEVLAEFGFAADEIGALKQDKVVRKPDHCCMQD
jgi:crotonobetainyl-CoA:carnitine CoA-transferase CaiB-like acyl-CoA transferase